MNTIAIDFDGTISCYSGFKGKGIFGPPVHGARRALDRLKAVGCTIIINTTRSEVEAIRNYLELWELPFDYINFNPRNKELDLSPTKVIADVYIDDRNISFDGNWEKAVEKALHFKPWYKS